MNAFVRFSRFTVRLALAAICVMPLVSLNIEAQSAPSPTASGTEYNSRFDFSMLYSYFQAHGADADVGISYNNIRLGAYASGAYYFNRRLGLEAAFEAHPDGNNDGLFDAQIGPIARYNWSHFTLFAHGLIGVVDLAGPNTRVCCYLGYTYHNPWTWGGPSYTAGGGLDWNISRPLALRLFQADYTYNNVSFGAPTGGFLVYRNENPLGGRAHLPGLQASAGLVWRAGDITPPPPVSYTCSVSPSMGYPGDPITVTGTAMNLNPKKTATYSWTSTGGAVNGSSSTATLTSTSAGTYTVNGHVTEGSKAGQSADCTATYTVQDFGPPTASCSASPSSVNPGDSSTITISASSPQNRPLTYSYNATAGSISGTTSSTTLSTVGAAPGTITVTCGVADDKGHNASATTSVNVIAPPPPPPPPPVAAPQANNLCSISFERDAARPTRVDNEAKACLDDITLALQRSTDAKLALVGNEDAKEQKLDANRAKGRRARPSRAELRAINTKDYLVNDKGLDASRIMVYTGTDDSKTVTTTLIPMGATNPAGSDTTVDESTVKAEGRKPIP